MRTRVLASGLALGHYVPALAIRRDLALAGEDVEVEVFEEHLAASQLETIDETRRAYRETPRLARMGRRLAAALAPRHDAEAVDRLADAWDGGEVERLIVLSGYWRDAVAAYLERRAGALEVEWCHVDTTASPSWQGMVELDGARHVWLGRADRRRVWSRLRMSGRPIVPFEERPRKVVAHGGGWGLGPYRDAARELLDGDYGLDVVLHGEDEPGPAMGRLRFFRDDPAWRPWHRGDDGRPFLPRCAQIGGGEIDAEDDPGVLELTRNAHAVLSKPGGATLWDGLSTATPVIFTSTDADHESGNADLWCHLGWGMSFDAWQATGFATAPLERMHDRLRQALMQLSAYPASVPPCR